MGINVIKTNKRKNKKLVGYNLLIRNHMKLRRKIIKGMDRTIPMNFGKLINEPKKSLNVMICGVGDCGINARATELMTKHAQEIIIA